MGLKIPTIFVVGCLIFYCPSRIVWMRKVEVNVHCYRNVFAFVRPPDPRHTGTLPQRLRKPFIQELRKREVNDALIFAGIQEWSHRNHIFWIIVIDFLEVSEFTLEG